MKNQPAKTHSCVKIFFLVIAILWGIAGYFAWQTGSLLFFAEKVEGKITGVIRTFGPRNNHSTPSFSFTDKNGKTIELTSKVDIADIYEGDIVTVMYDPKKPENAVINNFWTLWHATIIPFAIGALLAFIPTVLWVSKRFENKEPLPTK